MYSCKYLQSLFGKKGELAEYLVVGEEKKGEERKRSQDIRVLPEKTLGILVKKLFTVRMGMPFFSSCMRAITSSIWKKKRQRGRWRVSSFPVFDLAHGKWVFAVSLPERGEQIWYRHVHRAQRNELTITVGRFLFFPGDKSFPFVTFVAWNCW